MASVPHEASIRARRTIEAAEALHERALAIAAVCARAEADQVVVAVVEADCTFGGAWPIPVAELSQRVAQLEAGGWT